MWRRALVYVWMCMYYCECESRGGIGIGAYTGMERSQQATIGQGSDSVTRTKRKGARNYTLSYHLKMISFVTPHFHTRLQTLTYSLSDLLLSLYLQLILFFVGIVAFSMRILLFIQILSTHPMSEFVSPPQKKCQEFAFQCCFQDSHAAMWWSHAEIGCGEMCLSLVFLIFAFFPCMKRCLAQSSVYKFFAFYRRGVLLVRSGA